MNPSATVEPTVAVPRVPRVNLRTPDVMAAVQAQVEGHYRSEIVDRLRANGGTLSVGDVTILLAKQFGFCYGVERAIDLAYAARKVFADRKLFILGEIIHNPEVNEQIRSFGIRNLIGPDKEADIDLLDPEDVVIVPAFGAEVATVEKIKARGCQIVDTTCGDVMSVWKRVRQNANDSVTSIIHGKAQHEETRATSSHALGKTGQGHYLVVLTLAETDYVCDYIRGGGDKVAFLEKFAGATSPGFDPDLHLRSVGVANQTTMLRGETEEVQRRVRQAVAERDGIAGNSNFRFFDTICGATQERQDALLHLLNDPLDLLVVVGGYNSSNTSHLAEMGQEKVPTYFIRNSTRMQSLDEIVHYDLHEKKEVTSHAWLPPGPLRIGITAGASCPNNLIEETILRLFELRGIDCSHLLATSQPV